MKIIQPTPPLPERKPDTTALPSSADTGAFQRAMAANGLTTQKLPPLPASKPAIPGLTMALANDSAGGNASTPVAVPLPGHKPIPNLGQAGKIVLASADNKDAADIIRASQQVAGLSGHSFASLLAQATQESGLNASVRNKTSSAAGPFQILERTWLDLFRRHGAAYGQGELASKIQSRNGIPSVSDPAVRKQILDLRHDVDISAGMAARYLSEGRERLEKRLKRPVSEAESRLAYVMGVGGASKLIRASDSNSKVAAADLLPAAAKANKPLFHDRGSGRALTAGEVVTRLTNRMEADQRDMFALMARAADPRLRLDDQNSPMGAFQVTGLPGSSGPIG